MVGEQFDLNGVTPGIDRGEFLSADILKAMEAGLQTGMQYANTLNNGGGLKVESLDGVIKVLEYTEKQLVLWKNIGKKKIYNTVHQYNQLVKYGNNIGIANLEGETPQFTDSQYRRKPIITKFLGVSGQVTHPATLVRIAAEGDSMYELEVRNKTLLLLQNLNVALSNFDSSCIDEEFSGIWQQHVEGILDIYGGMSGKTSEAILDTYYADPAVVNADGNILSDFDLQEATNTIVNLRYGFADKIIANPIVFTDYVNAHTANKVLNVNGVSGSMMNARAGLQVTSVATQFGDIDFMADPFFDSKPARLATSPATNDKAPAAPVKDNAAAVAVVANDTKTKFTNHAGAYLYAVAAKNRYGESALTKLNDAGQAVLATDSVDLKFTAAVDSVYPTQAFVIYRSEDVTGKNAATANYYPIFQIPVSQLASGYDGAAANTVRDRNRSIAGTHSALVFKMDDSLIQYLQLADTMKMEYAITSPSRRFSILNYGTPVLYAPGKFVRICNIGRKAE